MTTATTRFTTAKDVASAVASLGYQAPQETLAAIQPRSQQHAAAFRERLDAAMTQPAGLGILQDMLAAYAGITGSDAPAIPARQTIICCADHGVAAMKVSAYPPETTVQMTANYLISRGAVANALSKTSPSAPSGTA